VIANYRARDPLDHFAIARVELAPRLGVTHPARDCKTKILDVKRFEKALSLAWLHIFSSRTKPMLERALKHRGEIRGGDSPACGAAALEQALDRRAMAVEKS